MRNLGLLLLVCIALFFAWTMLTPVSETNPSLHHETVTTTTAPNKPIRKVTLSEVTEKSRDTLTTTATYLSQEKELLQGRMSVTLKKLDEQLSILRAEANRANPNRKNELNLQISNLENNKAQLINLQQKTDSATESAWNTIKQNWNHIEIDINAHLKPDQTTPDQAEQAANSH